MKEGKTILKLAEITDFPFFFQIKSEGKNIKWTGHSQKPNYDNLYGWYKENLLSTSRKIFIYFENVTPVGYAYVDDLENCYETSVAVSEDYEGKGYGKKIVLGTVNYVKANLPAKPIFAWILDKNKASIKIHEHVGYIKTKDTKDFQLDNGVIAKMILYKLLP